MTSTRPATGRNASGSSRPRVGWRQRLEWKRVKVTNDFRFKTVDGRLTLDEDEMRLLYVAVTRARHVLDVSELCEELLRLFNSRC
jgi:hypothetical protein